MQASCLDFGRQLANLLSENIAILAFRFDKNQTSAVHILPRAAGLRPSPCNANTVGVVVSCSFDHRVATSQRKAKPGYVV
jgi:hypothetical protein